MALITAYGFNDATGTAAKLGVWYGTGSLDALGEWAVDYTEAGFSVPPSVNVTAIVNTATDTDSVWNGGTRTCTTTAAAGISLRGNLIAALGNASVRQAAAGSTFYASAIGPIA